MSQSVIAETAGRLFGVPVANGQITGIEPVLLVAIAIIATTVGASFVYGTYAILPVGRLAAAGFIVSGATGLIFVGTSLGMELFSLEFAERLRVVQAGVVGAIVGGAFTAALYRPKKLNEVSDPETRAENTESEDEDTENEDENTADQKFRATAEMPEVNTND